MYLIANAHNRQIYLLFGVTCVLVGALCVIHIIRIFHFGIERRARATRYTIWRNRRAQKASFRWLWRGRVRQWTLSQARTLIYFHLAMTIFAAPSYILAGALCLLVGLKK